jgi:hypothetical protein
LLRLRTDIDINADAIAEEILRGAAHRAYTDLNLFIEGQGLGTFVQQGFEQINNGMDQYAAWFTLLGAQNEAGTAYIINASSVQVDDGVTTTSFGTLVSTWNGMQASIDSIQTVVDGQAARVALTLDVNGYVTGWEWTNGGTPETGSLVILVPNLLVADPGNGLAAPRSILSYNSVLGVLELENVYAKLIKADSIETNMLKDNSVSEALIATNGTDQSIPNNSTFIEVVAADFTVVSGRVAVDVLVQLARNNGDRCGCEVRLKRQGSIVETRHDAGFYPSHTSSISVDRPCTFLLQGVPAGTYTFSVEVRIFDGNGGVSGWTKTDARMIITEFKK